MKNLSKKLVTALLASVVALPAFAEPVTVVLSEELDVVDPCETSRSNLGRVILQNLSLIHI